MDVNIKVPAIEKLLDYAASGVGSVAGPMLATWQARKIAEGNRIAAEGQAKVLKIQAEAQAEAREVLLSSGIEVTGELEIAEKVHQRIQFQEQKRQANIEAVVGQAAKELGEKTVQDKEPDHDWTARFFNEVQDVSSEEMQALWAKVLSGEVERPGSTSIRTLGILRNLDRDTANLFRRFFSTCVYIPAGNGLIDARVCSLGGQPGQNCLQGYGFSYDRLNLLNEHGLVIPEYNTWFEYRVRTPDMNQAVSVPFVFQGRWWLLEEKRPAEKKKPFRITGVALTAAGKELSKAIEIEPIGDFENALKSYLDGEGMAMHMLGQSPHGVGEN